MRVAVMLPADGLLLPAQASAAVLAGTSVVALPACHISFYTDHVQDSAMHNRGCLKIG